MTNSSSGLATDDLGKVINRKGNPHWQLWMDYIHGKISGDELHRTLRGKMLKSVYKMKKERYPLKPTEETPANMEGWGKACAHVEAINAGNKYWLGVLLNDIIEEKLEAKQGKQEEIEELLNEWY